MRMLKDGKVILNEVEIAKRFWNKAKGLMFRRELPEGRGLLMVFEKENEPGIWMLGMRFPIDLIFLNAQMQVIDIRKNIKPMKINPKSWKVYFPKEPAKYVLEVRAGFAEKQKIKKLDFLELAE